MRNTFGNLFALTTFGESHGPAIGGVVDGIPTNIDIDVDALLRRVRDFAQVRGNGDIDLTITKYSLEALNIDKYGLDEIDNKILLTVIDKFHGGPVGLNTIATALGEDAGTIEEVYEPFLIKEGFIKRTPRGREVMPLAYEHLGRSREAGQGNLFQ